MSAGEERSAPSPRTHEKVTARRARAAAGEAASRAAHAIVALTARRAGARAPGRSAGSAARVVQHRRARAGAGRVAAAHGYPDEQRVALVAELAVGHRALGVGERGDGARGVAAQGGARALDHQEFVGERRLRDRGDRCGGGSNTARVLRRRVRALRFDHRGEARRGRDGLDGRGGRRRDHRRDGRRDALRGEARAGLRRRVGALVRAHREGARGDEGEGREELRGGADGEPRARRGGLRDEGAEARGVGGREGARGVGAALEERAREITLPVGGGRAGGAGRSSGDSVWRACQRAAAR